MGATIYSPLFLAIVLNAVSSIHGGQKCTLEVYDRDKKISGLCTEEFKADECKPFVESFNRGDLPSEFQMPPDAKPVSRPSVEESTLDFGYSSHTAWEEKYLIPSMTVKFSSPHATQGSDDNHPLGYLLIWKHGGKMACRLFKFATDDSRLLEKRLHFRFFVEYLKSQTSYDVMIYSMPPPSNLEDSKNEETHVRMRLTSGSQIMLGEQANPGDWLPSVGILLQKGGQAVIRIGFSPPSINLTMFEVKLVKLSYDEDNAYEVIDYTGMVSAGELTTGQVIFKHMMADSYRIVVQVVDPYRNNRDKCLCWVKLTHGRDCENACGNIQTQIFVVEAPKPGGTDKKVATGWATQNGSRCAPSHIESLLIAGAIVSWLQTLAMC